MALYGPRDDEFMTASTSTNSDRQVAPSAGWTTHLSRTFTTSVRGPIIATASLAQSYESGAVNAYVRFQLDSGTHSETMALGIQRDSNRMDHGSGSYFYNFANVGAGSHTIYFQMITVSGSYMRVGGPHNPGSGSQMDHLCVMYLA